MNRQHIIKITEDFVRQKIKGYDSGHDWWHIERVRNLARYINEIESLADPFILEIAVLLHDTVDSKFADGRMEQGYKELRDFIDRAGMPEIRERVIEVVQNVSFSNKTPGGNLQDPVLLILQDADKIDAIGAIGIARAFNYGGFRNNPIYVPGENREVKSTSTIGHFYDKLLKLRDMMNTSTGRRIAEGRHKFLEDYLKQFYIEWDFPA